MVFVLTVSVSEDADDARGDPLDDKVASSPVSPKRNALIQASFCRAKNSASTGRASGERVTKSWWGAVAV